jgi:hypothetical protein
LGLAPQLLSHMTWRRGHYRRVARGQDDDGAYSDNDDQKWAVGECCRLSGSAFRLAQQVNPVLCLQSRAKLVAGNPNGSTIADWTMPSRRQFCQMFKQVNAILVGA